MHGRALASRQFARVDDDNVTEEYHDHYTRSVRFVSGTPNGRTQTPHRTHTFHPPPMWSASMRVTRGPPGRHRRALMLDKLAVTVSSTTLHARR